MSENKTQPLRKEPELVYEPLPSPSQLDVAKALGQFLLGLLVIREGSANDLPVIV